MGVNMKSRAYENTRSLLIRYMADFSNTSSPPKTKKGWYALVTRDTGDVWLAESKTFDAVLQRYRSGSIENMPIAICDAIQAGQKLDLWFCTKPEIDIEPLRIELEQRDQLLCRTSPRRRNKGKVFVIRHSRTNDYFLTKSRQEKVNEFDVLSKFLYHISNLSMSMHHLTNKPLQDFVTENSDDILKGRNFTISEVGDFNNVEEAVDMMANFSIDSVIGRCLNHRFMRH